MSELLTTFRSEMAAEIERLTGEAVLPQWIPEADRKGITQLTILCVVSSWSRTLSSRGRLVSHEPTALVAVLKPLTSTEDEIAADCQRVIEVIAGGFLGRRYQSSQRAYCQTVTQPAVLDRSSWRETRQAMALLEMVFQFYAQESAV